MEISIVIPVYNEEKTIESVINQLKEFLRNNKVIGEIVCVNDCSTDNSGEILENIKDIKVINHKINKGYGAALKSGIKAAKYDVIVTMDSDGQHNPDDILKLLEKYESETDLIIGARQITSTFLSRIPGKLFLKILASYLFRENIEDLNSGFRIFNKNIAQKFFFLCSDRFSFSTSLTLSYYAFSMNVKYTPIKARIRKQGKSKVNYKAGLQAIMKILQIAMTFKPIRVMAPIVLFFTILTIFSLTVDLINANLSDSTVLLFSVTVILSVFALISEQLRTIRLELMRLDFSDKL